MPCIILPVNFMSFHTVRSSLVRSRRWTKVWWGPIQGWRRQIGIESRWGPIGIETWRWHTRIESRWGHVGVERWHTRRWTTQEPRRRSSQVRCTRWAHRHTSRTNWCGTCSWCGYRWPWRRRRLVRWVSHDKPLFTNTQTDRFTRNGDLGETSSLGWTVQSHHAYVGTALDCGWSRDRSRIVIFGYAINDLLRLSLINVGVVVADVGEVVVTTIVHAAYCKSKRVSFQEAISSMR